MGEDTRVHNKHSRFFKILWNFFIFVKKILNSVATKTEIVHSACPTLQCLSPTSARHRKTVRAQEKTLIRKNDLESF